MVLIEIGDGEGRTGCGGGHFDGLFAAVYAKYVELVDWLWMSVTVKDHLIGIGEALYFCFRADRARKSAEKLCTIFEEGSVF